MLEYAGHLNDAQIRILRARAGGARYAKIRSDLQLCHEEAVARFLVRTVLGFEPERSSFGGRHAYLSDVDMAAFKSVVSERARSMNCITKSEAVSLAFHLRQVRTHFPIDLLHGIECPRLVDRLREIYPPLEPDDETVRSICCPLDLVICRPQTLELARRMFCDSERITNFFVKFSPLFQRDSRLIWNADETQVNAMKRLKVICARGDLPLVTGLEQVPHITGMVSISGGGKVLEPIVILKILQHLRELVEFESECYFVTSANGWMTKDIWVDYAIVFSAQIPQYRLTLPPDFVTLRCY
jgi:hypothetical protein